MNILFVMFDLIIHHFRNIGLPYSVNKNYVDNLKKYIIMEHHYISCNKIFLLVKNHPFFLTDIN